MAIKRSQFNTRHALEHALEERVRKLCCDAEPGFSIDCSACIASAEPLEYLCQHQQAMRAKANGTPTVTPRDKATWTQTTTPVPPPATRRFTDEVYSLLTRQENARRIFTGLMSGSRNMMAARDVARLAFKAEDAFRQRSIIERAMPKSKQAQDQADIDKAQAAIDRSEGGSHAGDE